MDLKARREQIVANINYLQGQLALVKELEAECSSATIDGSPNGHPVIQSTEE